jgi:uncharacterized protein YbjT (DUF2867 family)
MMGKIVNVIGATGLVGKALVYQLLDNKEVELVRVFARRKCGISHPNLDEHLVDFSQPESWKPLLTGDVLFSALGTTLKKAGSKSAQYQVDYTFQYDFARIAADNGVPAYGLVSSAGASANSAIFYSRMKGELDDAVQQLPFRQCLILRPSILSGEREQSRPAERIASATMQFVTRFAFRKYRPISGDIVAKALINGLLPDGTPGAQIAELDEIFSLAGK